MGEILQLDIRLLYGVLFWGYLLSFLFLIVYRINSKDPKAFSTYMLVSRGLYLIYYFVAFGRGLLPDWLSVSIGNSMLLAGYYAEARVLFGLVRDEKRKTVRFSKVTAGMAIVLFNVCEILWHADALRIILASLGTIAIIAFPIVKIFKNKHSGVYTRLIAGFYAVFLALTFGRVVNSMINPNAGIMTGGITQLVTFLVLLFQMLISMPVYMLIMKEQIERALHVMATTDKLTGINNRHAFTDAAEAIFRTCGQSGVAVAVMFIDIDNFKRVNDTYGHAFGDLVLARLAEVLGKCIRGNDLNCRYGGEEFVVFLTHADRLSVKTVAYRIVESVRLARFDDNPGFSFTVSIGCAWVIPTEKVLFKDAIAIVDEAMYEAKRAGRNRVIFKDLGVGV